MDDHSIPLVSPVPLDRVAGLRICASVRPSARWIDDSITALFVLRWLVVSTWAEFSRRREQRREKFNSFDFLPLPSSLFLRPPFSPSSPSCFTNEMCEGVGGGFEEFEPTPKATKCKMNP